MTTSISKVSNHITISILKVKDHLVAVQFLSNLVCHKERSKLKHSYKLLQSQSRWIKKLQFFSVYIPPAFSLTTEHLQSLLSQLPAPYILVGDLGTTRFGDVKIITVEETLLKILLQITIFA